MLSQLDGQRSCFLSLHNNWKRGGLANPQRFNRKQLCSVGRLPSSSKMSHVVTERAAGLASPEGSCGLV